MIIDIAIWVRKNTIKINAQAIIEHAEIWTKKEFSIKKMFPDRRVPPSFSDDITAYLFSAGASFRPIRASS